MEALRIINLSEDKMPYDFENAGFILITGITESNLNDAVTLAESARKIEVAKVGIPAGNDDIRRFANIADAVIFSHDESETSQGIAEEILDRDRDIFDIPTMRAMFRNAGTVYYGTGSGDDMESALRKAAEMCGDIHGAKTAFVTMSLPPTERGFDEVRIMENILKEFCGDDVSTCFSNKIIADRKITAKIFALMYDVGYTSWEELFANESAENITTMIENGLDERTRKRLGTEKSFFEACLKFGTPELVRKFISKGHNPKELETDGIFPGDLLADCLNNDIYAGNTGMTGYTGRTTVFPTIFE